jgi:hypothetical protein
MPVDDSSLLNCGASFRLPRITIHVSANQLGQRRCQR